MRDTEKNILVAERESDTRKFIASSLKKYDCEVICAADGKEALRIVDERRPDLVVSDTDLEGVSGYDVCRKIKSDDSPHRDIPVVLMSHRTSLQDRLLGFLAGAEKYICKPFNIEELLDATNYLMNKSRQYRQYNLMFSGDPLFQEGFLRQA